MSESLELYDKLYELVAADGRERALLGDSNVLARKAFARSRVDTGCPLVILEIPFAGEPRFDLHVALGRDLLRPDVRFAPGGGSGYEELFYWFANETEGGAGLGFGYDSSTGDIDSPAMYLNLNGGSFSETERFFEKAAGSDAPGLYRGIKSLLPRGWSLWYTGVFPGRPGSHLRTGCMVSDALKRDYARDLSLLERDLRNCGFTALTDSLVRVMRPLFESPYAIDFQFDVKRDGTLGDTLGISATIGSAGPSDSRAQFSGDGSGAVLMRKIEGLGLADDRWQQLPGAMFGRLCKCGDGFAVLRSAPTFVKLRLRAGEPLDAKIYLQAEARPVKS